MADHETDRPGTGVHAGSAGRRATGLWTGEVDDATLLGTASVRGHLTSVVSFAAPQMPAFFTVWIDRATDRTLELRMTTAAHFMRHVYGPFDAPLQIRPPT